MKHLNIKQRVLIAFTLFGMFFGAGNLIFPVHLGQLVGSKAPIATVGFIVTAVGIPILAVAAIGITHSDGLKALSTRIGSRYSYLFTSILYLTIGPFFAIPRCASTSFTMGIKPFIKSGQEAQILFLFSLIFFIIVLFFSLYPAKITVWIGKIINPVFLVFLFILIITALLHPAVSIPSIQPIGSYQSNTLLRSAIEGYGTMDGIAGLAFGIIVIDMIRAMGIHDDHEIAREVLISGALTGILMAIIYAMTIIIGAQSRGLFSLSENGGIALTQLAFYYLGHLGIIILSITIILACLKTSLGLVTSCAEAFHRMFPHFISYKAWAILFSTFSFVISNIGLSKIIEYAIPVLMFLYPLTISIVVLALFEKVFHQSQNIYRCVTVFTAVAALFDLFKALPLTLQKGAHLEMLINTADKYLPLFNKGFGWIGPAIIGLCLGIIMDYITKNERKRKNQVQ